MKQVARHIEKDSSGYVVLIPEEAEDMWHIYNLIRIGDFVKSSTVRKVISETSTGTTSSQRRHTTLTISVESVDFDPGALQLHLKGRNQEENELVKMGAYHTLDIEPNRKFTLQKAEWDFIDFGRLNLALDPTQSADVAAVVLHEGLAHVCLITPAMTLVRAKIEKSIPRKRKGYASQHEKGMSDFFDLISQAFLRHVNFQIVKCVLIASRGFLKEQFVEHLMKYAENQGKKITAEQRSKFLLTHASSGFKHALKEVLEDPAVSMRLADTKAQSEVKALNQFFELMSTEPDRAYYGYKHVQRAHKEQAIDTLMLADSLFRAQDIETRKKYVKLVEDVKENDGKILIFSSMHVSGEQLAQLTGCAAILRFPMPDIEEESVSDTEGEK